LAILSRRFFVMCEEPRSRPSVLSACFGTTDSCLRGGTRAERPAGSALSMARTNGSGAWEPRHARACRGSSFLGESGQSPDSVHFIVHRFVHSFLATPVIWRWNKRSADVLFNCASGVERQTKHGTPAASAAGVYSFMGHQNHISPQKLGCAPFQARTAEWNSRLRGPDG